MTKQDELIEALETLVDKHTLREVVDALSLVCTLKAEHIEDNWQDIRTASVWERAAKVLRRDSIQTSIYSL